MDVFWILVAFVSGAAARLLRLPSLVGFLVAGMALAAFDVSGGPLLAQLGDIGVSLLLFTVGLDLHVRSFSRGEVLGAGGVFMVIASLLGMGGAYLAGVPLSGSLVLGLALAASSIILAAKTLDERNELTSYHGRVAIGILLLQTVAMGVLLIFVGGSRPSPWSPALLLLLFARPALTTIHKRLDSKELVLLFGLLLAMGGVYLFEQAGFCGELGALAAGALLAGTPEVERLSEKLWSLKEVFLAAFFLRVGLVGFPGGWDAVLVLALIGYLLIKGGLYFGLLALFRLKARTAFITSVALTSFSGITLIVGVIAADAGLIPDRFIPVLAAATAASYIINAVATRYSLQIWRRVARLLSIAEREGRHRETLPTTLGNSRFLVIGMGRAGTAAYDRLCALGHSVTGMDADPSKLAEQRAEKRRVVYGDGRDRSMWQRLDLSRLRAIVLGVPGGPAKIEITQALRDAGYEGTISALTSDTLERAMLVEAGASAVHLARDQAGRALAEAVAGIENTHEPAAEVGLDITAIARS